MSRSLTPKQKPRKNPQQARSRHTLSLIHQAAARILEREGPAAFNTNHVAHVAGISVGSLYQYYPNKTALLLDLHERNTYATWVAVESALFASRGSARERLAGAVRYFFHTEAQGAPLRALLADAAVALSETAAFAAQEDRITAAVRRFLEQSLGRRGRRKDLEFETELVMVTVAGIAEHLTRDHVGGADLQRWADTIAAMLADRLGLDPA